MTDQGLPGVPSTEEFIQNKMDALVRLMNDSAELTAGIQAEVDQIYDPVRKSVQEMEEELIQSAAKYMTPEIMAAIEAEKQAIIARYLPEQGRIQAECDEKYAARKSMVDGILNDNQKAIEAIKAELEPLILEKKETAKSSVLFDGKKYAGVYFTESTEWDTKLLDGAKLWEPKLAQFCKTIPPKIVWKKI